MVWEERGRETPPYPDLWRRLRRLRPDIVHTYNIAAIDCAPIAVLAGAPVRVHAEHGRDVVDLYGTKAKCVWLRRLMAPFIHRVIPVSRELETWLIGRVGLSRDKVVRICNGVDATRFHPPAAGREALPAVGFGDPACFVIGCVGRIDAVKDHASLVRAFVRLVDTVPEARTRLRLAILGDGALLDEVRALVQAAGVAELVWLPGAREDVADLLRAFDVFVLPSLVEGIALTLLEAMACARPVIATRVGGNPELIDEGVNGQLVPVSDPVSLAAALEVYFGQPELARAHGAAGRRWVEGALSIDAMVDAYLRLYDELSAEGSARAGHER